MALTQAASSCRGEKTSGPLPCKVLITFEAKVELSVKVGEAGQGIPRFGSASALFMKMLMAL